MSTRSSTATASDTAVILYTSGTTGTPEGRRTHPRQPAPQRRGRRRDLLQLTAGRRDLRRAAAVPLVRADLHAQRRGRRAAPALTLLPRFDPAQALAHASPSTGRRSSPACRPCTARCWPSPTGTTTTCRRCGCACPAARPCRSRCCARSRTRSAARCSRATACRRPRRSRRSTIPDRERKPGSIGTPDRGRRDAGRWTTAGNEVPPGEVGEIAIRGHNIMKGYWQRPEATAAAISRRLVPHRRHRPGRRGRLLLHRRPEEGHDHPRRLQRLPAGDRGGAVRAPGRRRGRRHRHAAIRCSARRSAAAVALKPGATVTAERTARATSRRRSRPTSTRGTCGSSTPCRRGRPARSSSARSSRRPSRARDDGDA